MQVPWQDIAPDTLANLIEEFVTRDGTDYGAVEIEVATRVEQVRRQLERGDAVIWFDQTTESISIFTRQQLRELGLAGPDTSDG
ncbi:YheU family protein [Alcanivorax quisquiliarum]|uniref:YheU family protein n=1 Tax=Alcanivorax quisquiliarum TaxID=2933565 RepID=A0ABT0E976_9GAMM|nr:YheU family protein [Alcanivorax quisquiliarum]MCK0538388.1 YheU family protein [Alcanivorax quisquiliarum]